MPNPAQLETFTAGAETAVDVAHIERQLHELWQFAAESETDPARRAITRAMKRTGRVWIRIFPDVPVSTKPAEVRMGSGKGSPEFWVVRVAPGRIMFEVDGVPNALAREALTLGAAKLPIRTKFVARIGDA